MIAEWHVAEFQPALAVEKLPAGYVAGKIPRKRWESAMAFRHNQKPELQKKYAQLEARLASDD